MNVCIVNAIKRTFSYFINVDSEDVFIELKGNPDMEYLGSGKIVSLEGLNIESQYAEYTYHFFNRLTP